VPEQLLYFPFTSPSSATGLLVCHHVAYAFASCDTDALEQFLLMICNWLVNTTLLFAVMKDARY